MWFRIFGVRDAAPEPAKLLEHLHTLGIKVEGHFKGDDLGWFHVEFVLPDDPAPLTMDRFLAEEDDIRDQLNAWAAWLENVEDPVVAGMLMQRMIGANQVFALEVSRDRAEEDAVAQFCRKLCQYLARSTDGVYQVDARGFFAADGK